MKRIILLTAAITILSANEVLSQDDSTRYIFGLPVSDDDTARQFPERDRVPPDRIKPVPTLALPAEVREALETGKQYKGWQDSTVYLDINTRLYIVPIKHRNGVKIFGLNEKGEPVTYDEVSRD